MEKLDNISSLNFSKHYIPILGTLKLKSSKPEDRLILSLSKGEMIVLAIPVIINNNISKSFAHYNSPKDSELLIRYRELRFNGKGFYVFRQTRIDTYYVDKDDILVMNALNNNIINKILGGE